MICRAGTEELCLAIRNSFNFREKIPCRGGNYKVPKDWREAPNFSKELGWDSFSPQYFLKTVLSDRYPL